jgi:Uma2 family endonuclease
VGEYWIVSWPKRQIEVYRRNPEALALELVATLYEEDNLQSPLLPDFKCQVSEIFEDVI